MAHKGFTLIEILIVIVIIGITITFALLSFGDFGASRRLRFAADQLVNTLKMAQQQALLEGSTLGLAVTNTSYRIVKFHPPKTWATLEKPGIFKAHYFPDYTLIKLNQAMPSENPYIIINSSGEISPFFLHIGTSKEMPLITIQCGQSGSITIETSKK